jgi:hypothetical protein
MKRFLATSALLSLLVLPVMASADDQPRMPRTPSEAKWTSEPPAYVPVENGQRRRVESSAQATDATASHQQTDALQRSIEQYQAVNPSTNSD